MSELMLETGESTTSVVTSLVSLYYHSPDGSDETTFDVLGVLSAVSQPAR
jgi:hypothetical protein